MGLIHTHMYTHFLFLEEIAEWMYNYAIINKIDYIKESSFLYRKLKEFLDFMNPELKANSWCLPSVDSLGMTVYRAK